MFIAHNGRTPYRIVMAHPVDETVKYACDELRHYVYESTGASVPITTEQIPAMGPEILVGYSERVRSLGIELSYEKLGEEGYIIKTVGNDLVLAGHTPRATLYAVYSFLETWVGCRWFSEDVSQILHHADLMMPIVDYIDKPAFEYREAYWREAFSGRFASRNKLNSNKADISKRQGGKKKFFNFHHSFDDIISPEDYFDSHPEYFSMVDGERVRNRTQLCLTNPEVLSLSVAKVRQWIRDNPDCTVFSVAQNDWDNHCTCPRCLVVEEREGSPSGPIIEFVNKIADDIKDDYPNIMIHTFAYQYSRKAPRFAVPRDNVIVRLCDIECCFSHPLSGNLANETLIDPRAEKMSQCQCSSEGETDFLRDLREWGAICKRLYIWDYVTNFAHYLMPFPNFDVLQSNFQLFQIYGAAGVLEQGNFSHGGGGHLCELQVYLQAKLLWNPNCNWMHHLREFVDAFYGLAAASYILKYIDLWQTAVRPWHMGINDGPDAPWIDNETLHEADELLNHALFATKDVNMRFRIEKLRLGLSYVLISHMPRNTPCRDMMVDRFAWELRAHGISEISERWAFDEALEKMKSFQCIRDAKRDLRVDYRM